MPRRKLKEDLVQVETAFNKYKNMASILATKRNFIYIGIAIASLFVIYFGSRFMADRAITALEEQVVMQWESKNRQLLDNIAIINDTLKNNEKLYNQRNIEVKKTNTSERSTYEKIEKSNDKKVLANFFDNLYDNVVVIRK